MRGWRRRRGSTQRDYGAEARAVRVPAVRRKEVVLLGADADVVYGRGAGFQELGAIRRRQVEQPPAARAGIHEAGVELRRDFLADLVAAPADAGPDAGDDASRAVFIAHEVHCRFRDSRPRAAPAGMDEPGDLFFGV